MTNNIIKDLEADHQKILAFVNELEQRLIEFMEANIFDYEQMKRANSQLISRYGRNTGAADHTDEYYHPLLQCHFGQMGDNNKINGLLLGYAKEAVMDYGPKRFKGIKHDEIMSDSGKDLYYNELGNKMGANNRNRPCVDLMDFLRTENMRNENIR